MKYKMNKKGSVLDLLLIGVILLVFGIVVLFGFKFINEFNTEIQANDAIDSRGKAAVSELKDYYPGVIDNSFLLLTISLGIGAFILSALVRISPIFIVGFIVVLLLIILMSGVLSNIYQEMAENSQLQSEADQLTFISNILEFLPLIVGVLGTILSIIMYKSWKTG